MARIGYAASRGEGSSQLPQAVVPSGSGVSVMEKSQDQTNVVVTAKPGLTIDCAGVADPSSPNMPPRHPNSSSDETGTDGGLTLK